MTRKQANALRRIIRFNYAARSQSLSRIHRIGQKNRYTYIHLVAEKTVGGTILQALAKKEDLEKIRPYEPNVVKAAWNIFGKSYEYRQKYNEYKAARRAEEKRKGTET